MFINLLHVILHRLVNTQKEMKSKELTQNEKTRK